MTSFVVIWPFSSEIYATGVTGVTFQENAIVDYPSSAQKVAHFRKGQS